MAYLTSVGDAIADGGATTYDSPSLTVSGTNKVMYALVGNSDSTPADPTGVAWDPAGVNQAMTQIGTGITYATYGNATLWRLIAPSNATASARATWAATKAERGIIVWIETDLDQTTPNGTPAQANGTASTVSAGAVSTSAGQRVLNFAHALWNGVFSGVPFNAPTGTSRQNFLSTGTAYDALAAQEETASGASTTTTWGYTAAGGDWATFSLALNAASGGGAANDDPITSCFPSGFYE